MNNPDVPVTAPVKVLQQIDAILCSLSGTKPKRDPQRWVDAAEAIENIVTPAIAALTRTGDTPHEA